MNADIAELQILALLLIALLLQRDVVALLVKRCSQELPLVTEWMLLEVVVVLAH